MISTKRVTATPSCSATIGHIAWIPAKSIWISTMTLAGLTGGYLFYSFEAVLVFGLLTAVTVCAGHSVGMHRLLVHRSFKTRRWIEYILVYLGTLVGMAGPFGMIRAHDRRDWLQRQANCHPQPAHRASFFKDYVWQMHCDLVLDHPPEFEIEESVAQDRFYQFLERTWMLQQVPLAALLLFIGDWGWLFWGICLRISVSLTGHWLICHFAHRSGPQDWIVRGAAVQGYNIPWGGLLTFGEGWHNNHHAFPDSAQYGLEPGQLDPGWWIIRVLESLGMAWTVKRPASLVRRPELQRLS